MKKHFINIASILFFAMAPVLTSCLEDGEDTIILESGSSTGIPSDDMADDNPSIGSSTTNIPNIQYGIETEGNDAIVRIDMTGIQDAGDATEWLRLIGTAQKGQNVWLSVDGKPKGILVHNAADDEDEDAEALAVDLVFLVDNSGSMSEEADAIARDIVDWAQDLSASGLDIKFGCVGYNSGVNGAINLTDENALSTYLNRSTGTSRTVGFSGSDASTLESAASGYRANGECGGAALRYADANMKFRRGANRIYVNFTDEPNQPGGNQGYSVEYFKSQTNWNTTQGTVHTVYSDNPDNMYDYDEEPWKISEYTGGTTLYAPYNFSGVTLSSLPVTGAMTNSYVIRFTNVKEFMDGKPHLVKITVLSEDGKTKAERTFSIIFNESEE